MQKPARNQQYCTFTKIKLIKSNRIPYKSSINGETTNPLKVLPKSQFLNYVKKRKKNRVSNVTKVKICK